MTVGEKIRQARLVSGFTQKELADALGVSESFISQYETGKRAPKIQTLRKIASALGMSSPAYFVFDPLPDDENEKPVKTVGEKIKEARKKAGMTQEQLAGVIGMATVTIRQYEADKREPSRATLVRLASALNLPNVAYFFFDPLPDDENEKPASVSADGLKERVAKLPPELQESFFRFVQLALKSPEKAARYLAFVCQELESDQ